MKGIRIFERFGFNQPGAKVQQSTFTVQRVDEWIYDSQQFDWIDPQGRRLSDYKPLPELMNILNTGIDTQSE